MTNSAMSNSSVNLGPLAGISKSIIRQLLTSGENRLQLLTVELQQERERLVTVILLAFAIAAFGLLAGISLTAMVVLLMWAHSPVAALSVLSALYGIAAIILFRKMASLLRDWQTLSASLDQFRKDTQCLDELID